MGNAFRNTMKQEKQAEYRALSSDAERRDWIAQYVMDPDGFRCTGTNYHKAINSSLGMKDGEWVTEAQLAGPKHLNDPES